MTWNISATARADRCTTYTTQLSSLLRSRNASCSAMVVRSPSSRIRMSASHPFSQGDTARCGVPKALNAFSSISRQGSASRRALRSGSRIDGGAGGGGRVGSVSRLTPIAMPVTVAATVIRAPTARALRRRTDQPGDFAPSSRRSPGGGVNGDAKRGGGQREPADPRGWRSASGWWRTPRSTTHRGTSTASRWVLCVGRSCNQHGRTSGATA